MASYRKTQLPKPGTPPVVRRGFTACSITRAITPLYSRPFHVECTDLGHFCLKFAVTRGFATTSYFAYIHSTFFTSSLKNSLLKAWWRNVQNLALPKISSRKGGFLCTSPQKHPWHTPGTFCKAYFCSEGTFLSQPHPPITITANSDPFEHPIC